jgi:ligand-binding SRPBCC domain-containing protein
MRIHTLQREQVVPAAPAAVFSFFGAALNLEAITPPFLRFAVVTPEPIEMRVGTLIQYRLRLHGLSIRWLTSIQAWDPGRRFVDVQVRGPYALWHHNHEFEPHPDGTLMRDVVRYALPLGPLGELAHRAVVQGDLREIFAFRARTISALSWTDRPS